MRRLDTSPRRRSILNRASLHPRPQEDKNDDEAERAELLAEDRTRASPNFSTPRSGVSTSRSVASEINSPQKEHFQGCLKLYAENKINKENAWNLQLIDFMSTMLRKHDSRMENLQMASTTLDASTRIYSFRVDAVHHDVLKMAGGLSKAAQVKRGKKPDEEEGNPNESIGDGDANSQKKKEKRKKSAKSSLSTNVESQLNTEIEVNECIDPFFAQLAATTGDMTSSNRAFNATLPIDDKYLGIILRSDLPYLDLEGTEDIMLDTNTLEFFEWKKKSIPTIKETDQICAPFHGFSIKDWDPDDEETKMNKNSTQWFDDNLNVSHQAMAFDMNAEVEPLPDNDMINGFAYDNDPHDAFESDEEEFRVMSQAIRRDKSKVIAHLVDMRPSSQSDGYLEYSYCSAVIGAWAGPSHWKLKNNMNKGPRVTERSQTIATVLTKRAPSRKKRQLDLIGEGMAFNRISQKYPEFATVVPAKIMIGRKTLAHGTAWNEKNFKTPVDKGYNLAHFRKFYLQETVLLSLASDVLTAQKNKVLDRISDVHDYDYNNDNDSSYCPNTQPDNDLGEVWLSEDCNKEGDIHNQNGMAEMDGVEMVEPPPKVAKIFIPYAMRAKKVDMKQLKHITWKILAPQNDNSEQEKEKPEATNANVNEISFMDLYKKLPSKLSTNMKESLSISLSLLAVLHLANEKGLYLKNNSEYTDFEIKGDAV